MSRITIKATNIEFTGEEAVDPRTAAASSGVGKAVMRGRVGIAVGTLVGVLEGCSVTGFKVVGMPVVGTAVVGKYVTPAWVGASVDGTAVVGETLGE